ncbi:tyrosinase family protein [Mycobacterium sp. Aquia_213]|uniref:tyrosinase family protein n=1 Tax=Mycobacterium sp. Aquia_213 TaxID=2991728 RepID=UPI00226DA166|nr:tyrosinase family protein [Mycobacterium sp. Aquia_213]WAC90203.1 tyrosinase family protein [Mycobacterium sp. Aquia_213]
MNGAQPRVRRSIWELQDDYISGKKEPLEKLWRSWKAIQELPADDPKSFFKLAGYHGEPFRGAGWGSSLYWGGYCHHGNVLFPTWHRVYLFMLEKALQSVPGCNDVMLPYWDETSNDSLNHGVPWALTREHVELDGQTIDNPLRSFRLTAAITDHIADDVADYSKPKGYETQRYPRSGLVGPNDRDNTEKHNSRYQDHDDCVTLLNENVRDWLAGHVVIDGQRTNRGQVAAKYRQCLEAPNYTVFSNTTSAAEWNGNHEPRVISLEAPHNSIHLAVGGFEVPGQPSSSPISGANGDMGENDTAGFDPIFFFHHCFVDYVFWTWQQRHGPVEIMAEYPGTNSVDGQGATPGVAPNSWLDLDSPLNPFCHDGRPFTSRDCLDTERQLGYTYSPGSLARAGAAAAVAAPRAPARVVAVSGINRAPVRGSFLVSVFGNVDGRRVHLGTEAVLSRWNVQYCANCQTHLDVTTYIEVPVSGTPAIAAVSDAALAEPSTYDLQVTTRDGDSILPGSASPAAAALTASPPTAASLALAHSRLEVH